MADLETEEKITVLLSHAAALRGDDKYDSGFSAVGDAIAGLKVLSFTTAETRGHYSVAACAAIDQLGRAVRERSPFTPEEIDRLITPAGRIVTLIDTYPPTLQTQVYKVKLAADRLLVALQQDPRRTTPELEGVPISIASFTSALEDHVRVRLDFSRLNDADYRTRMRVIRDPSSLVGWVSPWYVDADNEECNYRDKAVRPVEFVRSDGSTVPPPPSHAEEVARIAQSMTTGRSGPILIGAYRPFGCDFVVVIDGNHRLRATLANGGPMHVVALILYGPNDPQILSDLHAHQ